jgi:hypothetical protein
MPAPVSAHEHTFDRLPRPQKVLNPGRLSVPTASALIREQIRSRSGQYDSNAGRRSLPPQPAAVSNDTRVANSPRDSESPFFKSSAVESNTLLLSPAHPLGPMVTLGKFTQDKTEWTVRAQRGRKGLIMVKRLEPTTEPTEARILDGLHHRNVAMLVHSYVETETLHIALEYCRFTLAEILHVHLRLEEPQLQLIARSVSRPALLFDGF